ncbi:MAG: hypothetical protein R6T89_05265 [Candidatus Syntrophosphaera sp.]
MKLIENNPNKENHIETTGIFWVLAQIFPTLLSFQTLVKCKDDERRI